MEDWDIISPKDVIGSDQLQGEKRSLASAALPFTQSLLSQVTYDVLYPFSQLLYQPVSAAVRFTVYCLYTIINGIYP